MLQLGVAPRVPRGHDEGEAVAAVAAVAHQDVEEAAVAVRPAKELVAFDVPQNAGVVETGAPAAPTAGTLTLKVQAIDPEYEAQQAAAAGGAAAEEKSRLESAAKAAAAQAKADADAARHASEAAARAQRPLRQYGL